MDKISKLDNIRELFKDRKYLHFTTLKPPSGDDRETKVIEFCNYLAKRNIKYWIVKCQSENGYDHYHGIVSYPCDILETQLEKNKLAYSRKVNRDIGFCYPLQQCKVDKIYEYITSERNSPKCEYNSVYRLLES